MENNMGGDERAHQVKAEAMQGYNCFLYFHFHYQWQSQSPKRQIPLVCECVCACVLSLATFWLTGNKGPTEIVIHRGQRSHRSRGFPLELLCFCCHALCSCLFITLRWKKRRPPATNRAHLIFKGKKSHNCVLHEAEAVVISVDFFQVFISYDDLVSVLTSFCFICSGCKKNPPPQMLVLQLWVIHVSVLGLFSTHFDSD